MPRNKLWRTFEERSRFADKSGPTVGTGYVPFKLLIGMIVFAEPLSKPNNGHDKSVPAEYLVDEMAPAQCES